MTSLPETTIHRLQRLPQIPHVWEGDRMSVLGILENLEPAAAENSDCIVWLDGSDGFVRHMDIVRTSMGQEAMVRALLKAIENPQNPAKPARPHKIVVKDRELQFFLRGVLQNLEITVDYQPELPLLDELWHNFHHLQATKKTNILPALFSSLEKVALSEIWQQKPWDMISEEEIIKVEINRWNIKYLYLCVMGMLGQEFGIILYRSLESLQNFRQTILDLGDAPEEAELEAAFLQQDCWFLNFSEDEELESLSFPYNQSYEGEIQPVFGSIHPYEGIRSLKEEEEVFPIYIALKALAKFIQEFESPLLEGSNDIINKTYKLKIPLEKSYLKVSLSTMPEFTQDLERIWEQDNDAAEIEDDEYYSIDNDLIPDDTLIFFQHIDSDQLISLHNKSYSHLSTSAQNQLRQQAVKNDFPVIVLQTTRPKAHNLIQQLKTEHGVPHITFAVGKDSQQLIEYDLGILQTGADNFYLFAQFAREHQDDLSPYMLQTWQNNVHQFNGYCGIIVAMGAKGVSRGHPQDKDLLYLFYTQLLEGNKLNFYS